MQRFDFSSYYLKESLSDVTLLVKIDGDVKQRLPGHGVVLANVSRVFQESIEQQQGTGGRPIISLDVQPDQVSAACALVRFVYTGELPPPTSPQQPLLVHMLYLADIYGVVDCRAACSNALLTCHQLQAEALGLAFHLLSKPGSARNDAPSPGSAGVGAGPCRTPGATENFLPLREHCLAQLLQQFGDMEAVLCSPEKLAQLQVLPFEAVLALLHAEPTAAASENTVLAAVHAWMGTAVQRGVQVDAAQREQLAAAIRVPMLEPCYLATVLPRMDWVMEILGPHGVATAAGVARGVCDPHAEPVLGNPRACGALAAGWLKGPRPVPDSCCRTIDGEPALVIDWDLPLANIKAAFLAACAKATTKALLAQSQREAAAAAATAQHTPAISTGVAGWGLSFKSPMTSTSAAAAVSAVASAAARVFSKRKRTADDSVDDPSRDQQSSSTQATACPDEGVLQQLLPLPMGQPALGCGPAAQLAPLAHHTHAAGSVDDAEAVRQTPAQPRKRRRKGFDGPREQAAGPPAVSPSPHATKQGDRQLTALKQQQTDVQLPNSPQAQRVASTASMLLHEPTHPAIRPAADAAASEDVASGVGCAPPHTHQDLRPTKLRSPEAQFVGYSWRLVLYFQPCQPRSTGGAAAQTGRSPVTDSSLEGTAAGIDDKQQSVQAAHEVDLPADGGVTAWQWDVRLAIEARPAAPLQSGVSTVAFSGSLAVCLSDAALDQQAAAATPKTARHNQRGGWVTPAGCPPTDRGGSEATRTVSAAATDRQQQQQHPPPSPRRQLDKAAQGSKAVRYTCTEAAAAAVACSTAAVQGRRLDQSPGGTGSGPRGSQGRGHALGLVLVPEAGDRQGADGLGHLGCASGSLPGHRHCARQGQAGDDEDEGDDGCTVVGEHPAGTVRQAAVGASSRTPRRADQQHKDRAPGKRLASGNTDAAVHKQQPSTPSTDVGHTLHCTRQEDGSVWRELHLPQGSWVKSRACDTGFTNFLSITLQHEVWSEAAFQQYVLTGDKLRLRGQIWNVR